MIFRLYVLLTLMKDCVKRKLEKMMPLQCYQQSKKTFFSQTQSKKNLYDFKEDINMKLCIQRQDPELA